MDNVCVTASFVPFDVREDNAASIGINSMPGVKNDRRQQEPVEQDQDLSDRLILNLVFDVTTLAEDVEQVKVCIYGLARQRGLVKD